MATPYYILSDTKLSAWANAFATQIVNSPSAFFITSQQATNCTAVVEAFTDALSVWLDNTTRTPVARQAKDAARAAMLTVIKNLVATITSNPQVTDVQRQQLGLPIPQSRQPVPVPTARPIAEVTGMVGFTASIAIHDTTSKRGKADGAVAAWVYSYVGGATYPSDPSLWDFQGSTSTATFDITFPNTLAGGTQVWICCAWINAKQEAGPISVPVTTNLQGGGVSAVKIKIAA